MRLTWVTAGYGWVALVFPIVVAAPGYFAGRLSFGELMMVVGAFNQVQQSLRWFVDNTGSIADWRATLLRVMNFRQALLDLDAVEAGAGLIERGEDPEGRFTLDAVRVETRHGCIALDPPRLEVGPGERALILGKPGSGRTSFFLAIAGLWSAGSGRIGVPPDAEVAYLTQRPFLPSGSLRAALSANDAEHSDDELRAALKRVGLDDLAGTLDTVARWDRDLGLGEQERLSYARLLLARPKWLICDEGLDPVDEANRQTLLSILAGELAESAVVNISQRREPTDFYGKVVELITSSLRGGASEAAPAAWAQGGNRVNGSARSGSARCQWFTGIRDHAQSMHNVCTTCMPGHRATRATASPGRRLVLRDHDAAAAA